MKILFELRPYAEYEIELEQFLNRQMKEFLKLKNALDFSLKYKIVDKCYCVKVNVDKNGNTEDIASMSMQEINSCFEDGRIIDENTL